MEDIISVLEVAPEEMWETGLSSASTALRTYLKKELAQLKTNSRFMDALPGAVFNRATTADAIRAVLGRMDKIIGFS